jgi:hypothetical protein
LAKIGALSATFSPGKYVRAIAPLADLGLCPPIRHRPAGFIAASTGSSMATGTEPVLIQINARPTGRE